MQDGISNRGHSKKTLVSASGLNGMNAPTPPLREEDAAKYLGVTRRLLRAWRERSPEDPGEKGPVFVRLGYRTVRYHVQDLEAYLAAKRVARNSSP